MEYLSIDNRPLKQVKIARKTEFKVETITNGFLVNQQHCQSMIYNSPLQEKTLSINLNYYLSLDVCASFRLSVFVCLSAKNDFR